MENNQLRKLLEDPCQVKLSTWLKENNRFTDQVRDIVLALHRQGKVAVSICSEVIRIVSLELFNTPLIDSELPCSETCRNIVSEGLVLADMQASEKKNF